MEAAAWDVGVFGFNASGFRVRSLARVVVYEFPCFPDAWTLKAVILELMPAPGMHGADSTCNASAHCCLLLAVWQSTY